MQNITESWETGLNHHYIETNGITLHVVEAGPADGPLVILLHGFPEAWYSWRYQFEALASAGWRVLAPDQRGYNLSDKPKGVKSYRLDVLAKDILGLIEWAGQEKAVVAGHDWGAAVGWYLATCHPERIEKYIALNVPHPSLMQVMLRKHPRQLLKSWYIFFFQLPWLPEITIERLGTTDRTMPLRQSSRPGTFKASDLARYRHSWGIPGALTGMINWYRAVLRYSGVVPKNPRVKVPVLIIWGEKDSFLLPEGAEVSLKVCENGRLVYIPEATHWVQHEEPDRVNQLILGFITE
ncbi:MAG: alpha/beta hydrolase [Chloroflexi bacterium]|nr:alpha/beta hydrolase [Chloroflexota bacterium]OJV89618.1 MAG: alpha/beta hydrolase [Chloroflexi bacterium 54-19]